MPPKKSKKCKKPKQVGGWFWERSDPIFGKSNRWIGDKIIKPVDHFLKDTQLISRIITPVGALLGGPVGAVSGAVLGVGLNKAGYGHKPCRPSAKHSQYGCGILKPSGLPMRAKPIYKPPLRKVGTPGSIQTGGNSPFMLTNNSSFNSIKLR